MSQSGGPCTPANWWLAWCCSAQQGRVAIGSVQRQEEAPPLVATVCGRWTVCLARIVVPRSGVTPPGQGGHTARPAPVAGRLLGGGRRHHRRSARRTPVAGQPP